MQASGGGVFVPNQTSPVLAPPLPPISVNPPLTSAGSLPQPPSSTSGQSARFAVQVACKPSGA